MATVNRIAKYSDTSPSMIRYYFNSKYKLYEIVFPIYVKMLVDYLNNGDPLDLDLDFEKKKIEYPEMYEIAWFLANEFRTNSELVYRIMSKNPALRDDFHKVHDNKDLIEKFGNLIRVNIGVIILKNSLMITKASAR
jgi:AcrR family transcriptional regulator